MNTAGMNDFNGDMQKARNLIPGYLKKTLGSVDSAWMAQFLSHLNANHPALATEFAQEMARVQHAQHHLAQTAAVFDVQSGLQREQNRLNTAEQVASTSISASTGSSSTAPSRRRNAIDWIKSQARARFEKLLRMWQKPIVAATASAMLIGQMGLLAAVVHYMYNVEPQIAMVSPASGSKAGQDTVVLSIVFKDSTTAKQIQQLLDAVQAQVVGGPGAIGVWEVAVPKDKVVQAMKLFSTSKQLESVTAP